MTLKFEYPQQARFSRREVSTEDGYSPGSLIFWRATEERNCHGSMPIEEGHLIVTTASAIVGRIMVLPEDVGEPYKFWWEVKGWAYGFAETLETAKDELAAALREQHDWDRDADPE